MFAGAAEATESLEKVTLFGSWQKWNLMVKASLELSEKSERGGQVGAVHRTARWAMMPTRIRPDIANSCERAIGVNRPYLSPGDWVQPSHEATARPAIAPT
jgi:hypothetical protein